MYMIQNLKRFRAQTNKIKEYLELATKIQASPYTSNSAKDLDEILCMTYKRVMHMCDQLDKGISIEKELEELDAMTRHLSGVEIYVFPSVCDPDPPVPPPFSKN